jgi:SAM-dependent methyltransferase
MKKNAASGRRPPRPARSGGDLEAWIPHLARAALHRRPGPVLRLSEEETHFLGRAVRDLSRGFTGGRVLAGAPYWHNARSLAAYLLFFWPVSYEQALSIFRNFLPAPGLSGASVLDLGSGPGPMACAAFDCGARRVLALDSGRPALAAAAALARARGFPLETRIWNAEKDGAPPGRGYDLIVLGHLLNELWPGAGDAVERRARRVAELAGLLSERGRIVILEPALLAVTRDLLRVRNLLRARGFSVLAPCLRQGPCPCLESAAGSAATCHADEAWRPPAWYVRLAHRARLGKESLRFSFLVAGRPGETPPPATDDSYRVVSERMLSKSGRLRYMICNERGRFSLSAKPTGHERWLETFLGLRRYDTIRITGTENREHGLGLTPDCVLEKIKDNHEGAKNTKGGEGKKGV